MFLCPSTTPGSVSTSTSRSAALWTSAKLRICAWAKRMSSRSRALTSSRQSRISASLRRKSSRSQLSNLIDIARTATSPRLAMSSSAASTTSRTLASSAALSSTEIAVFRHSAMAPSPAGLEPCVMYPCRSRLSALLKSGPVGPSPNWLESPSTNSAGACTVRRWGAPSRPAASGQEDRLSCRLGTPPNSPTAWATQRSKAKPDSRGGPNRLDWDPIPLRHLAQRRWARPRDDALALVVLDRGYSRSPLGSGRPVSARGGAGRGRLATSSPVGAPMAAIIPIIGGGFAATIRSDPILSRRGQAAERRSDRRVRMSIRTLRALAGPGDPRRQGGA